MADIFGRRDVVYGGSFAADSAVVNFAGGGLDIGAGLLGQNIQFNYVQPIQRFFELGSAATYFFAGRPQGNGGIGRILGPRGAATAFYRRLGDVCSAGQNVLTFSAIARCNDGNGGTIRYSLHGVVLTSVGATVAAEDMILREQLQFMFFKLTIGG